jgi:predicted amidophosphoribosyltransferase
MMKSENISLLLPKPIYSCSPLRLKRVDELIRPSHPYIQEEDEIYYLGEYTVPGRFQCSPMNQLIFNYKKGVIRKGMAEWEYKQKAIRNVANLFSDSISNTIDLCDRATQVTFVPVPPSEAKYSTEYDERNYQMLKMLTPTYDVRELYLQRQSREALHSSKKSHRVYADLVDNYVLNEEVMDPTPKEIWLFDDTLIKGTHFKAAKAFLGQKFPNVRIVGFFIARSISNK